MNKSSLASNIITVIIFLANLSLPNSLSLSLSLLDAIMCQNIYTHDDTTYPSGYIIHYHIRHHHYHHHHLLDPL